MDAAGLVRAGGQRLPVCRWQSDQLQRSVGLSACSIAEFFGNPIPKDIQDALTFNSDDLAGVLLELFLGRAGAVAGALASFAAAGCIADPSSPFAGTEYGTDIDYVNEAGVPRSQRGP